MNYRLRLIVGIPLAIFAGLGYVASQIFAVGGLASHYSKMVDQKPIALATTLMLGLLVFGFMFEKSEESS